MLMLLGPLEKKIDELASLKETVQEIERKVQKMSDIYDEAMKKLTVQEAEMSEIKQRVKNRRNPTKERGNHETKTRSQQTRAIRQVKQPRSAWCPCHRTREPNRKTR
ncbi:unnamed protein product [Ixodes hexagonus]